MRSRSSYLMSAALLFGSASPLVAQAEPDTDADATVEITIPADPSGTDYDDGGRRDPFRSLIVPVDDRGPRGPGTQGMTVGELELDGIVRSTRGVTAVIRGSDGKTYYLKQGARVYDGTLTKVDYADGKVVFRRFVNDPRNPNKFEDIEKTLGPEQE